MEESNRNKTLEKKIDAYIKGNLSGDQADALWIELLGQPAYIDYLKTEMVLSHIYQSQKSENLELLKKNKNQEKTKSASKEKNRWWWYSAAAAVILAVVLTSVFTINRRANIHQWASQKIELGTTLASAPLTRAVKQIPSPDSLLNTGFKAAIDGNIAKAMEAFHLAVKEYDSTKTAAKATFNIAILQYNKTNYKSSIQYFDKAITHADSLNLLKERAYWYMGNAYINTGKLKKARKAISNAYSIGKIYSKKETELLKRLGKTLRNE